MIWEKGRKNDAKLVSVGHEYVLVFAKSLGYFRETKTIWREEKAWSERDLGKVSGASRLHGENNLRIETRSASMVFLIAENPSIKKWSRYKRIDANGPWRDRDISWPGGGGPRYDVPHNKTGQPCKVPERGWIYATPEEMQRQIKLVWWIPRRPHRAPFRKAHIDRSR